MNTKNVYGFDVYERVVLYLDGQTEPITRTQAVNYVRHAQPTVLLSVIRVWCFARPDVPEK